MAEVLTAVHAGLEVLGISLVTNMCVDDYETTDGIPEGVGWVAEVIVKKKIMLLELLTNIIIESK